MRRVVEEMEVSVMKGVMASSKPKIKRTPPTDDPIGHLTLPSDLNQLALHDDHRLTPLSKKSLSPEALTCNPEAFMVENSREKLLAAASRLFAERGRDAISTKEIAIAAGVSETHLFRLFKSKNRLYEEVVESVVGKGFSNIAGYGLDQIDFRKAIRSFANQMYDYLASHPEVVRLVFFSSLTDTKLTRKVFEPKAQILTDALARRIEQAQKAGLVRTDESSIALARALIAAVMYPYVSHALLQVGQIFKSEDNYRTNIEVWLDGIFTT